MKSGSPDKTFRIRHINKVEIYFREDAASVKGDPRKNLNKNNLVKYSLNYMDKGFRTIKEADIALIDKYSRSWATNNGGEKLLLLQTPKKTQSKMSSKFPQTPEQSKMTTHRTIQSPFQSNNKTNSIFKSATSANKLYQNEPKKAENGYRLKPYYLGLSRQAVTGGNEESVTKGTEVALAELPSSLKYMSVASIFKERTFVKTADFK